MASIAVKANVLCSHSLLLHYVRPLIAELGLFIIFFFQRSRNAGSCQLSGMVPFFTYPLRPEREKNYLNIATRPNYADGGNQTQAASTTSESFIHYTIAYFETN